jgi:hypothetical protein
LLDDMHDQTSIGTSPPTTNTFQPDAWYRARDVARLLGVSPRSIQRAYHAGRLRGAEINARHDLRVQGRWVIEWLEKCARRQDVA